ncbi:hypothetical protein N9954_00145 [Maribacter sp.]|nr:hypothetical protein [Maribacter sp.]
MKTIYFSLFALMFMTFSSCKKDDDNISESDRSEALLGQWKYTSITTDKAVDINGDGTVNIDLFNTQEIRQCIKDNLTFFTARAVGEKGDYSINDNGLPCEEDTEFSNIEEDRYELIDNAVIRFDTRNEMRIQELTKTKLVIETNDNLGDTDVLVTISYSKS